MITKYECTNISSQDPKALAEFYRAIGAPVFVSNDCYDGWRLGNEEEAYICVWDENKWGKSTAGYVTSVFKVDDLQKTYEEIIAKGIEAEPPKPTAWGGQELVLEDPDGNNILLLI